MLIMLERVKIEMISCGLDFVICLDHKNNLFGFGANYLGQLGCADYEDSYRSARKISLSNSRPITNIVCGYTHAIAYNSKEAYGWGEHRLGALGYD